MTQAAIRERAQRHEMPRVLNIGSGRKRVPGALNVDCVASVQPDLVVDLNTTPWPLPSNHFKEVHAYDVLEHLADLVVVMEEIYRICEDQALVHITVPHFSSSNAFTDPTHRHFFGASSFEYFTGEHRHSHYTDVRFAREELTIQFKKTPTNKLVRRFANRWPALYEERWAWTFPAWFLYARMRVAKNAA